MPVADLVLPCRDEGPALEALLPRIPAEFAVIVVDNGSRDDDRRGRAPRLGATVVHESVPGYGAAVHAGLLAATHDYVAFMDGDGCFDPAELLVLLDDVTLGPRRRRGRAAPTGVPQGVAVARACSATLSSSPGCDGGSGWPPTTSRRCGCARRQALLDLGVAGPPLRLPRRAAAEGSPSPAGGSASATSTYHPRAEGTRSKVSGSVRGTLRTARDFWRVLS